MKIFQNDWGELLADEMKKPYYQELRRFLIDEYRTRRVFPDMYAIFNALHCTSFAETKVVILGQDPYHGEGQAHGLSFSVQAGVEPPPSLKNIFQELSSDLGCRTPKSGCLAPWAKQGVLLLNASLSVGANRANSHSGFGWQIFTDAVIKILSARRQNLVFMLWGNFAKAKSALIDAQRHLILTAAHPSPLAGGAFFGCRHFSRCNEYLRAHGLGEIDWDLNHGAD